MADFELRQTGQEVQNILDYAETLQNGSLGVDENGKVTSADGDLATEKYVDDKVNLIYDWKEF